MDRADIHLFIKAMNGVNAPVDDHAKWVNTTCPLAFALHEKGADHSPSFGISIDSMSSRVHCFTCGSKGTLPNLVRKLSRLSNRSYPKLEEYVEAEEIGGITPEWSEEDAEDNSASIVSDDTIYMYDLAGEHDYLIGRDISAEVADRLGLRVDTTEDTIDGRERILFPVYTLQNSEIKLAGFTGRATDNEKVLKVKDYHGLVKTEALLGIEHIKDEHEFIIVVEGLFAYARLSAYGLPVVAIMGSNMSTGQARMLLELGKPVYLMFDADKAGDKAVNQTIELLDGYLPIYLPEYPDWAEGLDPDNIPYDDINLMIKESRLI